MERKDKISIEIIPYTEAHQPHFEKLNRQWIEEWFVMEDVDKYVLQNPEEAILLPGGKIFMAIIYGKVAGTVALRKINDAVFEFTKMAVYPEFRRKGVAEALSYASFREARKLGAASVILYSNTKNAGAIKLYEKLGFQHLPVDNETYKRANVKMEIDLTDIPATQMNFE